MNHLWLAKLKPLKLILTINNLLGNFFIYQMFSHQMLGKVNSSNISPPNFTAIRYIISSSPFWCMGIKMSGSESWGQEEPACIHNFRPTWPLQWVIYMDGSSKVLKCCSSASQSTSFGAYFCNYHQHSTYIFINTYFRTVLIPLCCDESSLRISSWYLPPLFQMVLQTHIFNHKIISIGVVFFYNSY